MVMSRRFLTLCSLIIIVGVVIGIVKFYGVSGSEKRTILLELNSRPWESNYDTYPTARIPKWVALTITTNDRELSPTGMVDAQVNSQQAYDLDKDFVHAYLTLTLTGYVNQRTGEFLFKGQPLRVSSQVDFNLSQTKVSGQIVSIYPDFETASTPNQPLNIKAHIYGLPPWRYQILRPGTSFNEIYSQSVIALFNKITYKTPVTSILLTPQSISTNRFLVNDPELKDADAEITLTVTQRGGTYYYAYNQPVIIGSTLTLSASNSGVLNVTVTDIEANH
jgi:hypothetical protein